MFGSDTALNRLSQHQHHSPADSCPPKKANALVCQSLGAQHMFFPSLLTLKEPSSKACFKEDPFLKPWTQKVQDLQIGMELVGWDRTVSTRFSARTGPSDGTGAKTNDVDEWSGRVDEPGKSRVLILLVTYWRTAETV